MSEKVPENLKMENHKIVKMTAVEIAEMEKTRAYITAKQTAYDQAEEKKIADKATGHQKLKDLGLTEDEIAAL